VCGEPVLLFKRNFVAGYKVDGGTHELYVFILVVA
jgi:hypothetical protein